MRGTHQALDDPLPIQCLINFSSVDSQSRHGTHGDDVVVYALTELPGGTFDDGDRPGSGIHEFRIAERDFTAEQWLLWLASLIHANRDGSLFGDGVCSLT